MKTIGDLERWLGKESGRAFEAHADRNGFYIKMGGVSFWSKTVEGAIENCLEDLRRRANQMAPVRETKPEPKPVMSSATWTLSGSSMTPKPSNYSAIPSISQAGQQAYQQQAAGTKCPHCGAPRLGTMVMTYGNVAYCSAAHYWNVP